MAKAIFRSSLTFCNGLFPALTKTTVPGRTFHSSISRCRQLNVGVMGAGRIATTVHLNNILTNRKLNLQWITEDSPAQVTQTKDLLGADDIPFHTSKDVPDLLSKKDLDAVFIFLPTGLHCQYVCDSLSKGKAVFVEKPAGNTISEIEKCYDYSEKYGKPLVTAFNKRFDPPFRNAVSAAREKSFGDVQIVNITSRDSPRPSYEFLQHCDKTGCNIFADMGVHDIDMLVWITNAERPESIYVTTHAHDKEMAKFGEADTLSAIVKYRSGVLANINISRFAVYGYDMRMEIFGTNGMASVENPRVSPDLLYNEAGSQGRRLYESFGPRFRESYMNEVNHFIDCVEGKDKPLITKKESVMAAEIIEKGLESHRLKQAVNF